MSIPGFKLFHFPATRSARVKWMLHEVLDDDFEVEVVQLYEGQQYRPAFVKAFADAREFQQQAPDSVSSGFTG